MCSLVSVESIVSLSQALGTRRISTIDLGLDVVQWFQVIFGFGLVGHRGRLCADGELYSDARKLLTSFLPISRIVTDLRMLHPSSRTSLDRSYN